MSNHTGCFGPGRQPNRKKRQTNVQGGRKASSTSSRALLPDEPLEFPPRSADGTHIDLPKYLAIIRASPETRLAFQASGLPESKYASWEDELMESIEKRFGGNTLIHGAPPAPDDPSLQYTEIPATSTTPLLSIRWWHDPKFGYNFDLIDPRTLETVNLPSKFKIQYYEGGWKRLIAYNEASCLARGRLMHGTPRWVVKPGTRISVFVDETIIGEVYAPRPPPGEIPRLKHSGPAW
ncbi:hypothetical protein OF83DRAFT_1170701 [Amylostereum chailletii]|nr:hypothetical protein OF83DRAFT_1170701 [Amylostereum chailletii]